MHVKHLFAIAMFAMSGLAGAAGSGTTAWDGLVEIKSRRLDEAYLAPGTDFRPYTKLMIDPTEAAFRKDWLRNMNDRRDISRNVTSEDASRILAAAQTNFAEVFEEAFTKAGWTVVTTPGPDVLRITAGVVDLYVNAPDTMSAGRSRSYTANAGEATMVLEVRDSQSNALLGRVLDRRETRDSIGLQQANSVTNTSDFRLLFQSWAGLCVKGLATLKSLSPLPATLTPGQRLD